MKLKEGGGGWIKGFKWSPSKNIGLYSSLLTIPNNGRRNWIDIINKKMEESKHQTNWSCAGRKRLFDQQFKRLCPQQQMSVARTWKRRRRRRYLFVERIDQCGKMNSSGHDPTRRFQVSRRAVGQPNTHLSHGHWRVPGKSLWAFWQRHLIS